ncbi:MAG: hypothetical protein WB789_08215 [Thermoplasmata archaeon]
MTAQASSFLAEIEVKGGDLSTAVQGFKGLLNSYLGTLPKAKSEHARVDIEDIAKGRLLLTGLSRPQWEEYLEKARGRIASARGQYLQWHLTAVPPRSVAAVAEREPPRDQAWIENQLEKRARELELAYQAQSLQVEQEKARLQSRAEILTREVERLGREKDEAERLRKGAQEAHDTVLHDLQTYADDPAKAAMQVVSRAASSLRRIESGSRPSGRIGGSRPLEEQLRVARTDLVEWANEILRPQGLHVSSIAELEAIGNVGAWEESEFHKSAAAAYLAARDELVFLDAMERGALRVPESIKSVISAGIDRAAREEMISSYEKKRAAHESMGEAAKSATAALASHRQATELARVLSESRTADPIPIILSFAGDGPEQGFDIRVPKGLEDGVLTDFLRRAVKTAAAAAGVAVTGEIQESTHLSFHCIPPDASATRMDVLRMQGDCREHLARLVIEASLGDAGPKFRVIDVRDFVI